MNGAPVLYRCATPGCEVNDGRSVTHDRTFCSICMEDLTPLVGREPPRCQVPFRLKPETWKLET